MRSPPLVPSGVAADDKGFAAGRSARAAVRILAVVRRRMQAPPTEAAAGVLPAGTASGQRARILAAASIKFIATQMRSSPALPAGAAYDGAEALGRRSIRARSARMPERI